MKSPLGLRLRSHQLAVAVPCPVPNPRLHLEDNHESDRYKRPPVPHARLHRDAVGRLKAVEASYRTLGYYDPRRDVTIDANSRTIAQGNVLSALIFDAG